MALYDISTGLLPANPLALSPREQNRVDRAAAQFELTEAEFRRVVDAPADRRESMMLGRLAEFDDNRRQILGVHGSLPGGIAYKQFWADWNANSAENVARVWAAFDRAADRFSSPEYIAAVRVTYGMAVS